MRFQALVLAVVVVTTGCAADAVDEDAEGEASEALTGDESGAGVVYFHGMSKLGFRRDALVRELGSRGLFTPLLTDEQLGAAPDANVLGFLTARPGSVIAGYSLGRIPVFRLMKLQATGVTRAVLVDPTFDSAAGLGKGIGGGIARRWLDGAKDRSFLLVYGDATKELGGERSYVDELAHHERAELCFVAGDHARFRRADMARALVAESCTDLHARLDP
jgi:hypothetical protein